MQPGGLGDDGGEDSGVSGDDGPVASLLVDVATGGSSPVCGRVCDIVPITFTV